MYSKKNIIFFIVIVFISKIQAQQKNIKWQNISQEKTAIGNKVDLLFKTDINSCCYIYSVNKKAVNHSKNTSIWFLENDSFQVVGSPESIFEIEYFNRKTNQIEYIIEVEGGFAQKIEVLKPNPIIKGQINYVLCNRNTNQQVAQVYHFEIQLKTKNN